jgi:hypothetical protein
MRSLMFRMVPEAVTGPGIHMPDGVVPSVGIVISVKGVVEFKGRGHCMLRSDMMETVQM